MAHQFSLLGGWDVTLVEQAPELGAGVRTRWYGGHPYTFGPRHFLTKNEAVFEYLNKHLPLRRCAHQFWTYVEGDQQFYNFPIHRDDIARMPDREKIQGELAHTGGFDQAQNIEEYWIRSVGPTLYGKFIDTYSKKMWQVDDNREIDTFSWSPKGVTIKEGPRVAWDSAISAYPYAPDGYNPYFPLATADAKVLLSTRIERYDIPARRVQIGGQWREYDVIVNTISPDILFDFAFGTLPYIGRTLHKFVLPIEHAFPEDVYFLYYAGEEQFTRLVEYKKFSHHKAPTTLICMEIPSTEGRHYPLPIKSEQARAQQYFDLLPQDVHTIGRNGKYRYEYDIDDGMEQAMAVAEAVR